MSAYLQYSSNDRKKYSVRKSTTICVSLDAFIRDITLKFWHSRPLYLITNAFFFCSTHILSKWFWISFEIWYFIHLCFCLTFFVWGHRRFVGGARFTRASDIFAFCRRFANIFVTVLFLSYFHHLVRWSFRRSANDSEKGRESLRCVPHHANKTLLFPWLWVGLTIGLQLVTYLTLAAIAQWGLKWN